VAVLEAPRRSKGATQKGMTLEKWETIRLRRRGGEKIKPLARELGVAPNTVRKYDRSDSSPKRQERPRTRLLDRYQTHIDELIRSTPKITAVRIGGMRRKTGATPVADEMADGTGEK
jgi:transcriptional regulator with XRE-family HTH domain